MNLNIETFKGLAWTFHKRIAEDVVQNNFKREIFRNSEIYFQNNWRNRIQWNCQINIRKMLIEFRKELPKEIMNCLWFPHINFLKNCPSNCWMGCQINSQKSSPKKLLKEIPKKLKYGNVIHRLILL